MHVAGSEIVLIDTVLGQEVEAVLARIASSRGFLTGLEHTQSLVAIEQVGSLTYLRADGTAVEIGVHVLCTIGQLVNLVFVMACAGTNLPLEVLQGKELGREAHVEAFVAQLTAIRPVLSQT